MNRKETPFIAFVLSLLFIIACNDKPVNIEGKTHFTSPLNDNVILAESERINNLLDSLNITAAQADFKKYFSYFNDGATYNGTDATENWDKESFMAWAKPYFDAKTTWNFKSVKRDLHFGEHNDIAWFDELLNTQMKICRGSGVVVKRDGKWKLQQYVLSMTIPNSKLDEAIKIKTAEEDSILDSLKKLKK